MSFFAPLDAFDEPVMSYLNGFVGRSAGFDAALVLVVELYLFRGILFCAFFWWAWFGIRADNGVASLDAARSFVTRSVIGVAAAIALSRVLQRVLPMRLRPLQDPQLHFVVPSAFDRDLFPPAWSGFPSDHAVIMLAFVTAVWLWSWRLGVIALAWVIVVVLFPRLYIGFHYPTDILVGAVIGVMMTLAAHRIPLPRAWIDLPGRWAQTQPQWFYAAAFLITYQLGTNFDDIRHIGNGVLALLCHLV